MEALLREAVDACLPHSRGASSMVFTLQEERHMDRCTRTAWIKSSFPATTHRLRCCEEHYVVVFSGVWEWCPPLARFLCSMEGADAQPTVGRAHRPIHVDVASYIGHARILSPCPPALVVVVTAFDTAISAPNSLTCWACEDDITCEEQSICASHRRQLDGQELALSLSGGGRRTKTPICWPIFQSRWCSIFFLGEPLARQ